MPHLCLCLPNLSFLLLCWFGLYSGDISSSGLKLHYQKLQFSSNEALLFFLRYLFNLSPSLLTNDILHYLNDSGIDSNALFSYYNSSGSVNNSTSNASLHSSTSSNGMSSGAAMIFTGGRGGTGFASGGILRDRGSLNSFASQHSYDSSDSISSAASSNAFYSNRFNATGRSSTAAGPASLLSPVADEASAELSDSGLLGGEDKATMEASIEKSALKREQNSLSSIHSSTNISSLDETVHTNTVSHDEYTQNNFDT